jgi:2'-5' RNA ligase
LAIVPPRAARDAVEVVRDPLRDLAPNGRWVHPSLWHLTLKFLGEVEDELTPAVADLVAEVTARHEAFHMTLAGSGVFPNLERPRTLWVGATEGAAEFRRLAIALDEGLDGLGFQPEDRPPLAHLTLARFRDSYELGELPPQLGATPDIVRFAVKEVVLLKSVLRPRGPDYSVVERMSLLIPEGFEPEPEPEPEPTDQVEAAALAPEETATTS